MYHPKLYGDFYEMGLKHGKLLKEKTSFTIPVINSELNELGLQSYEELKIFYPEVIEEIEGFAKGIDDTPERLGAFLLTHGIRGANSLGSAFAFKNNDSVVIGRNYDMPLELKKLTESCLIVPEDGCSYLSQSDVFIGRSDGVNEKGLSIAVSFVNGKETQPGIGSHLVVRKVLENCSNTAEAIELIQQTKVASANNFLLADRNFDIAVVESAPQNSMVRRPQKNGRFLHITNQFISDEMKPYDKGGMEWSRSLERYNGLAGHLSSMEKIDLRRAKEILSDESVCLDLRREGFGTVWSVVANLNELKIERAEAKPRPTNFKLETRLDWWLKKKYQTA